MRWMGEGIVNKKKKKKRLYCVLQLSYEHAFGTGFIVNKKIKHLIIDFNAESPRMCRLQVRGQFFNYSIICAHASTEEKGDQEQNSFCDDLDRICDDCPRMDVKIIIGDMNAKVGKEDV
jgi:exonuclease III